MSKDRALQRKPINDLIQAVGVGVKELKKAIAAYDSRVKRREAPQSSSKKEAGRARHQALCQPLIPAWRILHPLQQWMLLTCKTMWRTTPLPCSSQ